MTPKQKKIDPGLFEYEPEEPPEEEVYEMMAMRNVSPSVLEDPEDRARYEKFLETYEP